MRFPSGVKLMHVIQFTIPVCTLIVGSEVGAAYGPATRPCGSLLGVVSDVAHDARITSAARVSPVIETFM
jgi:hypothetical protein